MTRTQIAGLAVLWALAVPTIADAGPRRSKTGTTEPRQAIGPIAVSIAGARRVRGNRPEHASLHVNFSQPSHVPDAALNLSLTAFEHEAFPPGSGLNLRSSIVEHPPTAWSDLHLPDLPVRWTPKVVRYVKYFATDPKGIKLMRVWLARLGRYENTLRQILEEVGVPSDLIFVALAESGFDPKARSRVSAAGLWQFMKSTGQVYGLESGYWIDDRYDIHKSTYAAAVYLKDLQTRFGSWELALAAYNAGYGLVTQAMLRNNTNNYWALCEIENGLPYATTNYTPKIIAAAIIAHNRERFGFSRAEVKPRSPVVPVAVKLARGVKISTLANAIHADADLLADLNARFVRGRTPPKGKPTTAYIPKQNLKAFKRASKRLRADAGDYDTYTVRLGDDLASIARRFDTTERMLRRLNRVFDSGEITAGVTLVVPTSDTPRPAPSSPRERPLAALPALKPPSGHRLLFFRVTRASTSKQICDAFRCSWQDVVHWNDLDPQARLHHGQILQLVVPTKFSAEAASVRALEKQDIEHVTRGSQAHLDAELARRDLVRRAYKARKGTTLARIGKRFGLSVGSLARINGFSRRHTPTVGEHITVYVAKDNTRGTVKASPPRSDSLLREAAAAQQLHRAPTGRDASTATTAKLPGKVRKNTSRPSPTAAKGE
ncbi:MAG: transglycosylase SLT domain-containing protein [Nannocystaceae bacterium]